MEKRFILFIILSFAVIQLTMLYVNKHNPQRLRQQPDSTQVANAPVASNQPTSATLPVKAEATSTTPTTATQAAAPPVIPGVPLAQAPRVTLLVDDKYEIEFTTRGGVPVRWDVTDPRYVAVPPGATKAQVLAGKVRGHESLIDPQVGKLEQAPRPFETVLQEANTNSFYNEFNNGQYQAEKVNEGGLTGYRFTSRPTATGLQMVKTYLFDPKSFLGHFSVTLVNAGQTRMAFAGQIDSREVGLGVTLGPGLGLPPEGAMARFAQAGVVINSQQSFESPSLKAAGDSQTFTGQINWAGMQSMYFLAALIPDAKNPLVATRTMINSNVAGTLAKEKDQAHFFPTVEAYGQSFQLDPGQQITFNYDLFAGPKQRDVLKAAGHDLSRILFHNSWWWMRGLALGLMIMLKWFHALVGNWGVAIILLTFTVRLITFPLVQKGMKAQAKMTAEQARLKPLLEKINAKYKDEPQRRQQETMKLYHEHGVNPLGMFKGCIWMMIQIPIFFALYKLLYSSIELRGAPFLWVHDLSQPDQLFVWTQPMLPIIGHVFNLLPFITAITQMLASKFQTNTSAVTDPQQAQTQKMMMYFMPVFILFVTYGFPAGLMLYWLVSNGWQVLQQLWVNKHMPKPPAPALAAPARTKA